MPDPLQEQIVKLVHGKVVMITGGTGTIGNEIVNQLIPCKPKLIRIYSRDEFKLAELRVKYQAYDYVRFLMGDIRDIERLHRAMEGVQIVFHAAALKRVESTEYDPIEAIKTNVLGTQNVITATLESPSIERVVSISTDKAVNVTTTMGATKLLAERLITWASFYRREPHKTLCSVRFGNVLNSRGSVIPIWHECIKNGGPILLTHPEMRRFFMSVKNAVHLVLKAAVHATGGEVYVLRMNSVNIQDLAEVMIEELAPKYGYQPKDIAIQVTSITPGEKLDEDLLAPHELERSFMVDDEMAVVAPVNRIEEFSLSKLKSFEGYITSTNTLTKDELRSYLKTEGLV